MADEAGPSGAPKVQLSEEALKAVDEKFEKGVACIQSNDLDTAIPLLAEVLTARVNHYGAIAPECASAYYRYGSAMLYQAQDSADVFGGPIQGAAAAEEDKENGLAPEAAKEEDPAGDAAGDAADGTGASAGEDTAAGEDAAAAGAGSDAAGDDDAGVEGDLQLAWENLETARAIWARDPTAHATELAAVHGLLGEVAAENEAFEDALADYDAALEHQAAAGLGDAHRSVAELQFKRCVAAQFLGRSEEALAAVRAAVATLQRVQAAGGADDVAGLLEELQGKVEELEAEAAEAAATKAAMRSAMTQLQAAMAEQMGGQGGGPGAAAGTSNVLGAAAGEPARPPGASPVKDLGVVGRGTKRINLVPVAPLSAPAAGAAGPAEPAAKKKRSLEGLMGGDAAAVGFGAPAAPAAAPEKGEAVKEEEPPLPAFLQAYVKKD